MEIILFKKYLIRTDEHCFRLERVKNNKPPIVEIRTNKKGEQFKDYSNFQVLGYHSNFANCIKAIRRDELLKDTDHINKIKQLGEFIKEMDEKIGKELDKIRV